MAVCSILKLSLPSSPPPQCGNKRQTGRIIDEVVDIFLTGVRLQRVMTHLTDACVDNYSDPVCEVLCTMITCPLELIITEVGLAIFKNKSTYIYPYSKMSTDQINYVKMLVREVQQEDMTSIQHEVVEEDHQRRLLMKSSRTVMGGGGGSSGDNETKSRVGNVQCSTQMGGGVVIKSFSVDNRRVVLLPESVITAFCKCIYSSTVHKDPHVRYAICSIMLQRVCSAIHLSNDIQMRMYALLQSISTNKPIHHPTYV